MGYRAVITEIFLRQVSFFEVRMNSRVAFELIRKDTSRNRYSLRILVIVGSRG
jgi:hypothetical protein